MVFSDLLFSFVTQELHKKNLTITKKSKSIVRRGNFERSQVCLLLYQPYGLVAAKYSQLIKSMSYSVNSLLIYCF